MHIVSQHPEKSAKPEKGEGNVQKKQDELERMIFFKYQLYMQTQWLFILLYSALLSDILFFQCTQMLANPLMCHCDVCKPKAHSNV